MASSLAVVSGEWFLGSLFLYAAFVKSAKRRIFESHVSDMLPVHWFVAKFIALAVLCAEYTVGLTLVSGVWPSMGFCAAGILLAGFSIVVTIALSTGKQVSCNCFGDDQSSLSGWTLIRNIVLLTVAIAAGVAVNSQASVDLTAIQRCIAAAYGVTSTMLFLSALQLLNLWSLSRSFV